jgi:hypothetical protein
MSSTARLRWAHRPPTHPLRELPPSPTTAPSVLAFSLPKAGSTMLFDLIARLCPHAGLAYVSLEDAFYAAGVHPYEQPLESAALFRSRGYCYGGFRVLPPYEIPILGTARTAILVRDPRDMLVSLRHSVANSHWIPGGSGADDHFMHALRARANERTIDEYVLMASHNLQSQFDRYAALGLLWRSNVVVYRYEDVVYRKREWVDDLCEWFGWSVPSSRRDQATASVDVFPAHADPAAHVRQVHPGNHRTELAPETIRELDVVFERTLRLFGYERGAAGDDRALGSDGAGS